jgi:Leucine-rich repeat (LRR) protein
LICGDQVQKLYLDNNLITELPESLGTLGVLEWLRLDNNRLTHLPESIGNLGRGRPGR